MSDGIGQEAGPKALVFGGGIEPSVQQEIADLLAEHGVDSDFISLLHVMDDGYTLSQPFSSIRSPLDFMLKEAFESFQSEHPNFPLTTVSFFFSSLVECRTRLEVPNDNSSAEYTPQPREGIIVKPREALGVPKFTWTRHNNFAPYSPRRHTVEYAVQAGSLVDLALPLINANVGKDQNPNVKLSRDDQLLMCVGAALLRNFDRYI